MKKFLVILTAVCLLTAHTVVPALALEQSAVYPYDFAFEAFWYEDSLPAAGFDSNLPRKSCLLMEASTGKILYADNEDLRLPIASPRKSRCGDLMYW